MSINYQKKLDRIIEDVVQNKLVPTLFLHSCCAPCSSYCLEYLSQYFAITIFYYNPNITEQKEYKKRVEEQIKLVEQLPARYPISFQEGSYDVQRFISTTKGLEKEPEGGERCSRCYKLRLQETAQIAKEQGYDYFTTTLSISPHKDASKLNEIGESVGEKYGISHLPSDFKKKNGYQRSIQLSREYQLYRQNYCGCVYSKMENQNKTTEI